MRAALSIALTGVLSGPAFAAEVKVTVGIPRMNVAEYHRPYVAIWLERVDQPALVNLAVWHAVKLKDNEGTKWLKDMRQWWRRSGRDLQMPVDGVSSATRAPGDHQVSFSGDNAPLSNLAPGRYELSVEAAREVGGRELVRVPFTWPPTGPQTVKAAGSHELGAVTLDIIP